MSALKIFADDNFRTALASTTDQAEIARRLAEEGVRFEQWQATQSVKAGDAESGTCSK